MQERPPRPPSAVFNFLLAAVLGIPGIMDLVTGVRFLAPGPLLTGASAAFYAVLLARDGLHIRKTGQPALSPRRMGTLGFACLGIYVLGIVLKFTWAA